MKKLQVFFLCCVISTFLSNSCVIAEDLKKENEKLKQQVIEAVQIAKLADDRASKIEIEKEKEVSVLKVKLANAKQYLFKVPMTEIGLTLDETKGLIIGGLTVYTGQPILLLLVFLDIQ